MMGEIYPPTIRGNLRRIAKLALPKIGITPPRYMLWVSYRDIIPRNEFISAVDEFFKKIIYREFKGYWVGSEEYKIAPRIIATERLERSEIMRYSRKLVNRISEFPMKKEGKKIWLDHTPFNILHARFLHEMFPNMKLIHVYRDMRDVISSYKTKSWGGNTALDNTLWIKGILEKWEKEKERLPKDVYYEIKMEKMIKNPEKELKKLMDFLGIQFDRKMMEIDLSKGHVGRWKKDLTLEEIEVIEENLRDVLRRYGYL